MKILQALLDAIPTDPPIPVRQLVVGAHWTLVGSAHGGMGSTLLGEGPHGHSAVRDVGSLHQKSAQELARWVLSDNLLEASIGMAALNSLLDVDEAGLEEVNAAKILAREAEGKNLAIVGHFPFVERIKSIPRHCWVIEKRPYGDDLPEASAQEYIPQADVVAITGTAFINHTIEGLLALCRPGSQVMVLGPSTPLSPLLFDYGINYLSGSRVVDEQAAILTIQQGAALPQVQGVRLFTMSRQSVR